MKKSVTLNNRRRLEMARKRAISNIEKLESQGYEIDSKIKERIYKPIENKKWYTKQTERAAAKYRLSTIKRYSKKYKYTASPNRNAQARYLVETAATKNKRTAKLATAKQLKSDILYTFAKRPNKARAEKIRDIVFQSQTLNGSGRWANNKKYVKVDRDKFRDNINKYVRNISDESFLQLLEDYAATSHTTFESAVESIYNDTEALGEFGVKEYEKHVLGETKQTLLYNLTNSNNLNFTQPTNPQWFEDLLEIFKTDAWQQYRSENINYKEDDVKQLATVVGSRNPKRDLDVFIKVFKETFDIQQALDRSLL